MSFFSCEVLEVRMSRLVLEATTTTSAAAGEEESMGKILNQISSDSDVVVDNKQYDKEFNDASATVRSKKSPLKPKSKDLYDHNIKQSAKSDLYRMAKPLSKANEHYKDFVAAAPNPGCNVGSSTQPLLIWMISQPIVKQSQILQSTLAGGSEDISMPSQSSQPTSKLFNCYNSNQRKSDESLDYLFQSNLIRYYPYNSSWANEAVALYEFIKKTKSFNNTNDEKLSNEQHVVILFGIGGDLAKWNFEESMVTKQCFCICIVF